jgi:hypothetical protein
MRAHGEQMRKHMQEQAEHWKALAREHAQDGQNWRFVMPEQAFVEVTPEAFPTAPTPPAAPEAAELPRGAWWGQAAPAPEPKEPLLFKTRKPSKDAKPRSAPTGDVQEMQALLDQMRRQMDEMRAQMQALREELQKAPERSMR